MVATSCNGGTSFPEAIPAAARNMFVWLTFSQKLDAVISGCEAAWAYFGGVFKVVTPDNMAAIVADADPVNPRFTAGWLDNAQHCGFGTDATRVRHPRDKPRVERMVQYVRGNFYESCRYGSHRKHRRISRTTGGYKQRRCFLHLQASSRRHAEHLGINSPDQLTNN
ncbi:hypothetical protein [Saccharopolyspora hattusasensis]|uniref:hypothetical protein n=1 Tax=Saccharopolyspora hattusasensis TaxID=1128679 RepID=UPI003D9941D9